MHGQIPTQPPIQREPELLFLGLKRQYCEANCSPRCFARLGKSGAKYVTPFYAFLEWTGTTSSLLFVLRASNTPVCIQRWFLQNMFQLYYYLLHYYARHLNKILATLILKKYIFTFEITKTKENEF